MLIKSTNQYSDFKGRLDALERKVTLLIEDYYKYARSQALTAGNAERDFRALKEFKNGMKGLIKERTDGAVSYLGMADPGSEGFGSFIATAAKAHDSSTNLTLLLQSQPSVKQPSGFRQLRQQTSNASVLDKKKASIERELSQKKLSDKEENSVEPVDEETFARLWQRPESSLNVFLNKRKQSQNTSSFAKQRVSSQNLNHSAMNSSSNLQNTGEPLWSPY